MTKAEMIAKLRILPSDTQQVGYPENVVASDSTIDLPESMAVPLARVVSLLLANKIDEAVALADYFMGEKKSGEKTKG